MSMHDDYREQGINQIRTKLEFAESNPHIFDSMEVLDRGFVRLVDWMGDNNRPPMAARVSYGDGTKSVREDKGLTDYLIRHKHTSPLEMVEFTFHVKMPLFVFAQLVRHRTASLNAQSARYSVMEDEFYIPDKLRAQSKTNKQGSVEFEWEDEVMLINMIQAVSVGDYEVYEYLLEQGVAREMARMVLPQNLYTELYWKQDLHNLMHLLNLRLDPHAQWEIRQYAQAMYEIVKSIVPWAVESWENHVRQAVSLSNTEQRVLSRIIRVAAYDEDNLDSVIKQFVDSGELSKGAAREAKSKIERIVNV